MRIDAAVTIAVRGQRINHDTSVDILTQQNHIRQVNFVIPIDITDEVFIFNIIDRVHLSDIIFIT